MLSILINAYACSPGMGSEPGMAWNWCVNLANYCELHIVTEGEFRSRIEEVLPTLPQGKNMHFYYNPVPDEVRRMCWNQGDWRFYKHYREWQKKTYRIAKEICGATKIDILHQLNMIGFREPGYLWKLSQETGIPFVWGPVDAKDEFPMAFAADAGVKTRLFLWLKNVITCWQLKHSSRVQIAARTAKALLAASSNSVRSFEKYLGVGSVLLNETGCAYTDGMAHNVGDKDSFDILWVGKFDFRKQLGLALHVVAALGHEDIRLHVAGAGDAGRYMELAKGLGISGKVVMHGSVSHNDVQQLMKNSDMLLFTSVAEGTPHVVLEAIANGLPVVCFDTCGQGDCVNSEVGIKIPLTDPHQAVRDFADEIDYLYAHRDVLAALSANCFRHRAELSWDSKARHMVDIYGKCIGG